MSNRIGEMLRSYAGVLALGFLLGFCALLSQVRFLDTGSWWIINQYEPPLIQKGHFFLNRTVRNVLFKPKVLRPTGFTLSMKVKLIEEAALQIKFLQLKEDVSLTLTDNSNDILSGQWLDVVAINKENKLTVSVNGQEKLKADLHPVLPISLRLDKETLPLYLDDVVVQDESGRVVFKDNFGYNLFSIVGVLCCTLAGLTFAFVLYGLESLILPPIQRKLTPRKLRDGFFAGWLALPLYALVFGVFVKQVSPLPWIAMALFTRLATLGDRNLWDEDLFKGSKHLLAVFSKTAAPIVIAAFILWMIKQLSPALPPHDEQILFYLLSAGCGLFYLFSVILKNRKQIKFSGIVLTLFFVGLFGIAELSVRHSPLNTRLSPQRTGINFRPDNALFFVPPDFFVAANGKGQGEPFVVTGLNFRSGIPQKPKPDGLFRIMVLGGSNVWGDGIANPDDVFPAQLEEILKAEYPDRKIEVINAGMKGYILFQLKLMLELYALEYDPDLIILYANRNDSTTQYGPYTLRELWQSRKNLPSLDGVTEKVTAPEPTFGERLRKKLRKSRLYSGLVLMIVGAREENLAKVTRKLKITKEVNPVKDYAKTLIEMIDLCRQNNIRIILADEYMYWTQAPVSTDRAMVIKDKMRKTGKEKNVPYLPIHAILTDRHPDGSMMLKTDIVHLNKKGHREVAELLAEFLKSNSLLEN